MMTTEMSPVFVLRCFYRLVFIVSLPVADLYSRLLILLIFTNLNSPAMNYSNRRLHHVQSTSDIWYGRFILAGTAGKRFLVGTNKCKQLRRFWWRCLPLPEVGQCCLSKGWRGDLLISDWNRDDGSREILPDLLEIC